MFKPKLPSETVLNQYLYCVFDKNSGYLSHFTIANNDALAVREILLTQTVPLKSTVCLCIGKCLSHFPLPEKAQLLDLDWRDTLDFEFTTTFHEVSWSSYKFPENLEEAIKPLDITPDEFKSLLKVKE